MNDPHSLIAFVFRR